MNVLKVLPLLLLATCAAPAYAQQRCQPRGPMETRLTAEFGERYFVNKVVDGTYMELWVNIEANTYTVLSFPDADTVCLVTAGALNELPEKVA